MQTRSMARGCGATRTWLASLALCALLLSASAAAGEAEVRAAVAAMLPQAQIDSIAPAGDVGYFEVVTAGQVLYVSADGRHLLAGDLWRVDDRVNLTSQRKDGLRQQAIGAVDGSQRITFAADAPRHRVTVFTDFDCGYCQRMHQDIAQYNQRGISVEYLLYPRGGLGSVSFDKAVSVWCAADRSEAFTLAKTGREPPAAVCPNPIADTFALVQRIGGIIGTPTVVDASGAMTGYQTPAQLLARLDALSANANP